MYVNLDHATYFAPRGRRRLMYLGSLIAQRYLLPEDKLIGLVGDAGAGKSLLVRGMFPGLVLTNDDEGINVRPLPLVQDAEDGHFRTHTYHVDVRFESAFLQPWVLADAIRAALRKERRVVIEHFDLIYPVLKINAEFLAGIGEEVIVTRPNVYGPAPQAIADIVFKSLKYRKMAHTAEDLTSIVLESMGMEKPEIHSDVKRGFVLEFPEIPKLDLDAVEAKVREYISLDVPISYHDEEHIKIGETVYPCSGPRIHVRHAGEIEEFRLMKGFRYDPIARLYLLAGLVGAGADKAVSEDDGPEDKEELLWLEWT